MIVDHGGQPGSNHVAARVSDQQIELGVVGLPNCVWVPRSMSVDELKPIPESRRALMSQRGHGRIEPGDDRVYAAVGG